MCLVVLAYRHHPRFPLIVAANRDEFHDRPSENAHWWPDQPALLAGRDLEGGGSWLGLNRSGRLALVTNYREPGTRAANMRSRGELVTHFLTTHQPAGDFAAELSARSTEYSAFNLLVFDGEELMYLCNRGTYLQSVQPGIHGLSNHRLDTPWPKVEQTRRRLAAVLSGDDINEIDLFSIIGDNRPFSDKILADAGISGKLEKSLSAAFLIGPHYGTRCSTLVLWGNTGNIRFTERNFTPDGQMAQESQYEIQLD